LLYLPSLLINSSDLPWTVTQISEHEALYRLSLCGSIVTQLFGVVVAWFLYRLFYDQFKEAVIALAVLSFIGIPITLVSVVPQFAVLNVLDDPAQVMFLLKLHSVGTTIATIFWGLWLIPTGYIVIKSSLFPKVIGWFVIVAGVAYTISAFVSLMGYEGLWLECLDYLTFGEVIWMLWVMIFGARWSNFDEG